MVKAIASFAHKNYVCSVMEYMPGGDLSNLMQDEGGRFFEEEAKFYVAEIILALESLHKQGLVHRDLKPQNILLDANGHLKLADFGLSEQAFERKYSVF